MTDRVFCQKRLFLCLLFVFVLFFFCGQAFAETDDTLKDSANAIIKVLTGSIMRTATITGFVYGVIQAFVSGKVTLLMGTLAILLTNEIGLKWVIKTWAVLI